tara:strand:+ start:23 stop:154 length:132 start_codon:yes stop_codon:yes gene_type:complete
LFHDTPDIQLNADLFDDPFEFFISMIQVHCVWLSNVWIAKERG